MMTVYNNSTSCYSQIQVNMNVKHLSQLIVLILLNICVILGNGLVILAVVCTKKLRTLTSYLITSLAVADLMIGITVLPFSTINQIYDNQWLFDKVWCQIWLAIDVWMCTASIYNLTAIGIDRFVAIVKPLLYPSIITPKRGKMLICAAWISSFMICFPPMIVQWPQIFSSTSLQEDLCTCTPMQNSPGYIVYSALGSFHLPMIIIFSLYVRIYWTVRRSAKSLLSGYIHMSKKSGGDGSTQLRINKGGEKRVINVNINNNNTVRTEQHRNSEPTVPLSPKVMQQRRSLFHLRPFKQEGATTTQRLLKRVNKECFTVASFSVNNGNTRTSISSFEEDRISQSRGSWSDIFAKEGNKPSASLYLRKCQTNFNNYQKKMRLEIRAAKTVAIVTGCFIFCWLGFSVIYLLKAFPWCQNDCIPDIVFNVCFWLGYANSALNPFIYAVFNKEFRRAFRSLLYCNHHSLTGNSATSFRKLRK